MNIYSDYEDNNDDYNNDVYNYYNYDEDEFNNDNNKKSKFKYIAFIFVILLIISEIIGIFYLLKNNNNDSDVKEYKLVLKGDRIITLKLGETYIEPGFTATLNGENVNNKVIVKNNIMNEVGNYEVIYVLDNIIETRIIKIEEDDIEDNEFENIKQEESEQAEVID